MHDPDSLSPEADANLMRLLEQLTPPARVPEIFAVSTPSSLVDRFADLFHMPASPPMEMETMTLDLRKDRQPCLLQDQTDGLHPAFTPYRTT